MGFQRGRHRGGEAVAVDRERAAGRHLMRIAAAHDERAEAAHFLMQQADRIGLPLVGSERIGADEFGERLGLVRGGRLHRPHLVQHDRHAAARDLPCGLGAGQPAADDMDWLHSHGGHLKSWRSQPGLSPRNAGFRRPSCSLDLPLRRYLSSLDQLMPRSSIRPSRGCWKASPFLFQARRRCWSAMGSAAPIAPRSDWALATARACNPSWRAARLARGRTQGHRGRLCVVRETRCAGSRNREGDCTHDAALLARPWAIRLLRQDP